MKLQHTLCDGCLDCPANCQLGLQMSYEKVFILQKEAGQLYDFQGRPVPADFCAALLFICTVLLYRQTFYTYKSIHIAD